MSENHKYYYMKFKDTFFNDPKILLLEQMQDGPLYILLLLKFYLISLPYNGMLLIGENLPHTFQTLAIITRHQVGTVERAIKIFMKFGLIEILANHTYYMTDIQLFIGQSSTEAERKRMERLRLQQQLPPSTVRADICPPEIEISDKERDRDKVRVREKEGQPASPRSAFGPYENIFLSDNELAAYRAVAFRGCRHREIVLCRVYRQCTAGQGRFRDDDKLSYHPIAPDGDVSRRTD